MKNKPDEQETKPVVFDPAVVEVKFKTWFPELTPSTIKSLVFYQTELLRFNKTVNLISASTAKNAEAIHVGDSVLASGLIKDQLLSEHPVYDFGSGNGCPGLIFGILNPDRKVLLVDRDSRKLEFCKHVASSLKLANVSVLLRAVEDFEDGSIQNAICRGFAPFTKSLLMCRKTFPKGGRFFHLKGDGWSNELAQIPSQIFSHWTPKLLGQYRIFDTSMNMYVVMTEKIAD